MSKRFIAVNTLLISTSRTKKGGFAKVKFQLTAKVTAALEWPEMPEGTAEWCPDVDEVMSDLIELTPNNPELRKNSVSIDASSIGDFIVVRKRKKAGKNSVRADKLITEVIATIKFTDPTGCAKLNTCSPRRALRCWWSTPHSPARTNCRARGWICRPTRTRHYPSRPISNRKASQVKANAPRTRKRWPTANGKLRRKRPCASKPVWGLSTDAVPRSRFAGRWSRDR